MLYGFVGEGNDNMYLIVDFGFICLLFFIVLVGGITAGTLILDKVIGFLFGPLKIGLILYLLAILIFNIALGFGKDIKANILSRTLGTAFNTFGSMLKNLINVVFLLCILYGFLINMEEEKIFQAAFAILSDSIVFIVLFCVSVLIDGLGMAVFDDNTFVIGGILNAVLSVAYFMGCQELIIHFYDEVVIELFSKQQWLSDFILNSWFSALFAH